MLHMLCRLQASSAVGVHVLLATQGHELLHVFVYVMITYMIPMVQSKHKLHLYVDS